MGCMVLLWCVVCCVVCVWRAVSLSASVVVDTSGALVARGGRVGVVRAAFEVKRFEGADPEDD